MTKIVLGCMAAFLFSTAASAVPIEFRLDEPGNLGSQPSILFTESGITALAQGGIEGQAPGSRNVHQNDEGLGVIGDSGDASDLDGSGPDEFLKITFSESVRLLRIAFENVDNSDETALIIDGVQIGFGYIDHALDIARASANCAVPDDSDECIISIDVSALDLVGTTFIFGDAISGGRSLDDDDFRIEGMRIARVPEPSALMLLGVVLVGLGWMEQRRKRSDQRPL